MSGQELLSSDFGFGKPIVLCGAVRLQTLFVSLRGNCNERNLQREKTNSTGFPRKIPVDD